MTEAEQKQLTREGILLDLAAARPSALPLPTLLQGRRIAGLPLTEKMLVAEIDYLMDKNLVEKTASALSAGALRYRIAAAGIDHLEAQGLV